MKNYIFIFSLLLFSTAGVFSDQLWDKATTHADSIAGLEPGRFFFSTEIKKKNGSNFMSFEMERENYINDNGKLESRTLKALKNGKSILDEIDDSEKRQNNKVGPEALLFVRSNSESVTYTRLEEVRNLREYECAQYYFVMNGVNDQGKDTVYQGVAFLDINSGLLIQLSYTQNPNPKRVQDLVNTFDYYYDGTKLQKMELYSTGRVRIIISKKEIITKMVIEDFFEYTKD